MSPIGVEDIFQQAQQIAAEADQLLVDDDWERPEPQPMPLVLPPAGTEPAAAALVPCGGHHSSTPTDEMSLFSWAEFLADQPKPTKSRGRNPRPAGPSLFEWALAREQEAGLAAARD